MQIRAAARTDLGRQREENEDTFVLDEALGLFGVCDGMGGHAAGEVAAAVAREATLRTVRHRRWIVDQVRDEGTGAEALIGLLGKAVSSANADVFKLAHEHDPYHGMGCTLTMLLVAGDQAALASVGDSRFYLIRDGHGRQLTVDHTMGEEMRRMGGMTAEQLASFRYARLLSRSIGTAEKVMADTFAVALTPGDRFVVCTDGLSDYLESGEALAAKVADGDPNEVADRLVAFANASGGRDNITVVVGDVGA